MASHIQIPVSAPGYRPNLTFSEYHREAKKIGELGKFSLALEMHIWYHNHCLEYCPSLVGVRLSYALRDWMDLTEVYPPALDALIRIRNEKTSLIINGAQNKSLFQDVRSINRYLDEVDLSIQLFKEMEGSSPSLAKECWWMIKDEFFRIKEVETIRRYSPDLTTEIDEMTHVLANHREFMLRKKKELDEGKRTSNRDNGFRDFFSKCHLDFIEYEANEFISKAKLLLEIILKMGNVPEAYRLRNRILEFIDSEEIRNSLK